MYKSKVLVSFVLVLYILFAILEFSGNSGVAYYLNALIIPVIALIYMLFVKNKNIFFSLFLFCYSLSDLMGIAIYSISFNEDSIIYDFDYYVGNSLYILAYLFLFIRISSSMSFLHVLRNFKIHIVVLTILNIYLVYVLQMILNPYNGLYNNYYLELTYNIVMLLVLSAALLNYFFRDNKKSLYLFLGSLCIVFSEVIDVAYIYIAQRSLLNVLATSLALGAFYFFYQQSKLSNEVNQEDKYMIME
ncbi:hypothetical protein GCM10023311_05480 [Flaviramulus aquimarinus]|uniref:YhhN-like protein n=1 Tax=Flaviramulus aquimarinus TaxID=1170456 RepID=A0ABP9EYE5_9FLAO